MFSIYLAEFVLLSNGDACLIGPSDVLAYNNIGQSEIRHGLN